MPKKKKYNTSLRGAALKMADTVTPNDSEEELKKKKAKKVRLLKAKILKKKKARKKKKNRELGGN
jgi:hypothetical protein